MINKKIFFQYLLYAMCAHSLFQVGHIQANQSEMSLCHQTVAFPQDKKLQALIINASAGLKTIGLALETWTRPKIKETLENEIKPLVKYVESNKDEIIKQLEDAGFNIENPTPDSPITAVKGLRIAVKAFVSALEKAQTAADVSGQFSILSNDIAALHGNGGPFPYVCPSNQSDSQQTWKHSSNKGTSIDLKL